ncbi:MAG: MGH1-like glycoside hydrolase domain-containing protein, partial [Phycicoccus sp.]
VDLPDAEIEKTYYYRWQSFKHALKYTGPDDGWVVTEFLGPVGYSAPGGAISAAAGHHIYEGRWLRDSRYLDDYVDYWLTGAGSGPKPANDLLGKDTTDWAHQYSFWAADAVLARAEVDGRLGEAVALLPELEQQWRGWDPQFDPSTGLYWQTPVWDAMEYTASSYQSDDPYHGGAGYRPTLNAYQYGDARAIAELARLGGDPATADRYDASATALRDAQERLLWDPDRRFYAHVMRDDNPGRVRIADRELIGYLPWAFGMAPAENVAAWEQLQDPQGFGAPYGPTTVERRSSFFMKDAEVGCCRWSGPSWPYATSQTLTALGALLTEYPEQDTIGAADFTELLRAYALTQRKNGEPYVAEAHHPDEDRWLYDGAGHSEDYNHSTYTDLVLSTLIGIRGQQGDTVRVDP